MGRINLKSEKVSQKKYRSTLVRLSFPEDYFGLYLNGHLINTGTLAFLSLIREALENRPYPVQLELF